jgi:hypothetical protein
MNSQYLVSGYYAESQESSFVRSTDRVKGKQVIRSSQILLCMIVSAILCIVPSFPSYNLCFTNKMGLQKKV